jgi:hypothetical protein
MANGFDNVESFYFLKSNLVYILNSDQYSETNVPHFLISFIEN